MEKEKAKKIVNEILNYLESKKIICNHNNTGIQKENIEELENIILNNSKVYFLYFVNKYYANPEFQEEYYDLEKCKIDVDNHMTNSNSKDFDVSKWRKPIDIEEEFYLLEYEVKNGFYIISSIILND